jgi:hypothetical protein
MKNLAISQTLSRPWVVAAGILSLTTAVAAAPLHTNGHTQRRPMVLTEVGPHTKTWSVDDAQTLSGPDRTNAPSRLPHRLRPAVVAIETGMHYWDGQTWAPSEAVFEPSPEGDAFVASRVQHPVRLNGQINAAGAVAFKCPSGPVLHSTPVAIALYNAQDGTTTLIATLTNSAGVLIDSVSGASTFTTTRLRVGLTRGSPSPKTRPW